MHNTCGSAGRSPRCSHALRLLSPEMFTTLTGTSSSFPSSSAAASARAERSSPPPGGVPATISIPRSGRQVISRLAEESSCARHRSPVADETQHLPHRRLVARDDRLAERLFHAFYDCKRREVRAAHEDRL